MFKILFKASIISIILCAANLSFAAQILSSQAKISLITILPGEDLYSAFGHSAFWVFDPETHVDKVYGYGTYDFEQPNFYLNFVRGHLNYIVSVCTMEEQYWIANYEKRSMFRQELALDSGQAQKLFDFLEWNALPENRNYLYDFYLDNCASRLRDVLTTACGSSLKFDTSLQSELSFRAWMNLFLPNHPGMALGMNIGLGAPADRRTDYNTQMYLPINLKMAFANAMLNNQALVKSETEMLHFPDREQENSPILFIVTFSILAFSILLSTNKKSSQLIKNAYDSLLFTLVSLLGTVLLLLWLATDHWVCAWNSDLLWANPICFAYFLLLRKQISPIVKSISLTLLALSLAYMTIGYLLPEKPLLILFPLILAMQLRIVSRIYLDQKLTPKA
jgi:hypothetical protein